MNFASNISFQNGRDGIDRRAVGSGCRAENTDRRIEGHRKMHGQSIRLKGERISPYEKFTPIWDTLDEALDDFSAQIIPFANGKVARAADCSKETVKSWKRRDAFATGTKLLTLGLNNPTIANWIMAKIGRGNYVPQIASPEVMQALMGAMYQVAHQPGPDGDAVRAMLASMGRRDG